MIPIFHKKIYIKKIAETQNEKKKKKKTKRQKNSEIHNDRPNNSFFLINRVFIKMTKKKKKKTKTANFK